MPGAPSSFLLLVVRPGAPSSVLALGPFYLILLLCGPSLSLKGSHEFADNSRSMTPAVVRDERKQQNLTSDFDFFPECVAKGSRLTLGGLGVEPCSQPIVSMFATARNRPQPFATVRGRALRRCHWGKLLQVTIHGCVTCQFALLFHCDLHENDMSRKKRDAFRCTGAAFCEILSLLRSSIQISVWRVVFLGCWMWPCHWDLRFRVWHRSSVFVTSLS